VTARRAASAALALAVLVLVVPAAIAVAAGAAGVQTPTSRPPPTTASTTAPTTVPTGEVDTGTVPGAEDGTGKALLIGGAFIAIIVVGALIAKAMGRREDDGATQASAPADRPADGTPVPNTRPDERRPQERQADERTHGWADEPDAQPAIEPAPRAPLLFDQDQTDGHGWPVPGPGDREHR